jgi:iron complex outermembrane receptor protein
MTINIEDDERRIYGVEGQVDYFFTDSEWSTGTNFNVIKSETRVDGKWAERSTAPARPK